MAISVREALADWLSDGLRRRGVSQTALAEESQVSRDTISRILHKKTGANLASLQRLAEALRYPLPAFVLADSRVLNGREANEDAEADSRIEEVDQARRAVRDVEHTLRAHIADGDLQSSAARHGITAIGLRQLELPPETSQFELLGGSVE